MFSASELISSSAPAEGPPSLLLASWQTPSTRSLHRPSSSETCPQLHPARSPLCIFSPTGESRFWPKRLWVGQCSSVRNVGRTDGRTDLILALGKFCISAKERMSQQKKGEAKLRKGIERLHSWHASITKGLLDISFTQSAKIGAQSDL